MFMNMYQNYFEFDFAIENPTTTEYYIVIKFAEEEKLKGWTPKLWTGKDAVGGKFNSPNRFWTYEFTEREKYKTEYRYENKDGSVAETKYVTYNGSRQGYFANTLTLEESKVLDYISNDDPKILYQTCTEWKANNGKIFKFGEEYDASTLACFYPEWKPKTSTITLSNDMISNCTITI